VTGARERRVVLAVALEGRAAERGDLAQAARRTRCRLPARTRRAIAVSLRPRAAELAARHDAVAGKPPLPR
jgi:hypothetical protein